MGLTSRLMMVAAAAAAAIGIGAGCASSRAPQTHAGGSAGTASVSLRLPPPTGRYRVGTTSIAVADPGRDGQTMVQLFYPAPATRGTPAAYLTPTTARMTGAALHVPTSVLDSIVTHAFLAPRAAPGRHPVVLFSPGLTELRSDDTALDEDLASRGYVVVALDHPGESAVVEFPSGRVIRGAFHDSPDAATSARLRSAAVRARVRDVGAVLRALPGIDRRSPVSGRLDLTRIGMFGFSLGGATTDEAMHALPQIRAGVDLDGSLYGRSLNEPLDRPFLLLARDHHSTDTDPSWRKGWEMLHGYRRELRLIGSGHGDFTDLAGLIQQFVPGFTDPSGYYGPIPATRATRAIREELAAFFDHALLDEHRGNVLLDSPARVDRDLVRLR
jgi:dienelactone hydrolase